MEIKKISPAYKIIKGLIRLFYPKITVVGTENLPSDAAVFVGNHTQMNGPICCELYFPTNRYTWCAGEMMHKDEVAAYAFRDFWSYKPKRVQWFYKILAHLITPLSVCVFNNAQTIGVYHDGRVLSTFKNSVSRLQEGASIVIFPEHDVPYNQILYEFQQNFIDVAKLYYRRTGVELDFVPLYIAPKLEKMFIGKPIRFCAANPIEEERRRICKYLMEEITAIAQAQPKHIVVPYRNVARSQYPTNIPQ